MFSQSAQQIYDRLVAVKGDAKKIVLLGIGSSGNCEGLYGTAWGSTKLNRVTQMFIDEERGVWWDLCEGHLEDGLEKAFEVIENACDQIYLY